MRRTSLWSTRRVLRSKGWPNASTSHGTPVKAILQRDRLELRSVGLAESDISEPPSEGSSWMAGRSPRQRAALS